MYDGGVCREAVGVYSCISNSGNASVLLEAIGLPGMRMQNAQHGYIVDKLPNRLWFPEGVG